MDIQTADQMGRELAWVWSVNQGLVTPQMAKEAGLLEGFIYAPLSALAAMLSAPWGSKWRSAGLGLLLGAGIASTTGKEIQQRSDRGEKVQAKDLSPLMKAVLAGLSTGGAARVLRDIKEKKEIGTMGSILAAAPIGALVHSSNPIVGALVAGEGAAILSALRGTPGGKRTEEGENGNGKGPRGRLMSATSPVTDVLDDLSGIRLPRIASAPEGIENTELRRPRLLTSEDISRRVERGSYAPSMKSERRARGRLLLPLAPGTEDALLRDVG